MDKGGNQKKDHQKEDNNKKIDFKAKAIRAKESSEKRALAKAMKSGTGGGKGPNAGGGQKMNDKKASNF